VAQRRNRKAPAERVLSEVPNEEYHARTELGHSDVLRISRSPLEYRYHKEHPVDPSLKALIIGSAFHTAVLEPEKFSSGYLILPEDIDGRGPRTAHYREALEQMKVERPHKKWLAASDYDLVMNLAESVLAHPVLQEALDRPHRTEGTAFFNGWGCECKCRPDLTSFRGARTVDVIDLKSCQDASPAGFAKAMANWGYDVQKVFYERGLRENSLEVKRFLFVAVEKTPPYLCGVHEIHKDDLFTARTIIRQACATYLDCRARDVWPGYGTGVHKVRLPAWRAPPKQVHTMSSLDRAWLTVKQISTQFAITVQSVYRIVKRQPKITTAKFQGRLLINVELWNKHWGRARNGVHLTRTTNESISMEANYEDRTNDERQKAKKVQDT